jgi:hypothetical protein
MHTVIYSTLFRFNSNRDLIEEDGYLKLYRVFEIKIQQQKILFVKHLQNYEEFIKTVIKKNSVLEKRFFFIIPFNPMEMGASGMQRLSREYIVSRAKTSLYPKRDHLLRLLAKIGLRANIAQKQEIVELFYNLYNPSAVGRQLAPIDTYTSPIMSQ